MKLNFWKKLLVWQLVLCILVPTLPLEWSQGVLASAGARAEAASAARQVERSFMELADQAQHMEPLEDGAWRYAVIQPENYAVVLGHADPSARELTVPDRLGGADVVALAAGALADHAGLTSISLPGNVNAVAKGAIPAGALVRGYHGTYTHTYALENGYAFQSRSEYDFAQGVIDYADVRTDAFVRHSAYSLSLRKLEAARLREGSVFFLVDPNNAYQISYYRVLSLQEKDDGFVDVQCETPVMDEVMRSFSGHNEVMRLDPSTLVLGEGVSCTQARGGGKIDEVELPLNITIPLNKVDVIIEGKYVASFMAVDYEGKENTEKSATMDLTETLDFSITVEQKNGLNPDTAFSGKMGSVGSIAEQAAKLAKDFDQTISTPYSHPLGVGYVFSYAGIVTLQAQFTLDFEIKGSGTLVYKSETVTTYHGDTQGNATKSTVVENEDITGTAQIKGKVGVKAEANLYLYCVCVFQVSGFVGLEAELKWEVAKFDFADGKKSDFDKAINMMDCMHLEVRFVVEIGIKAGILKVFNIDLPLEVSVGAMFKPVNKKLIDKHFHLMPKELEIELLSDKVTIGGDKDQEHNAAKCPYGKSSLEVRLSIPVEKQKALYMQFDHLDPGFTINEPEDPTIPYDNYKLTYWFDDTKTTEANRVTFPYEIQEGDNLLYARILKKHYVHFIYEDGTEVTEPAYLFPGDTFTLPATERPTVKWLRVQSPYNTKEHAEQLECENGEYTVPFISTDIYMCAFEAPEIKVTFYESVDGGMMYETATVISKAGQTVEAPETTMAEYYEDAGWRIVGGEDITMPYTIPKLQTEPIKIVHFLGIKPAEDDFTWISGYYPSPSSGQSDQLIYYVTGYDDDEYAIIEGRRERWVDEDGYEHYSPTYNLVIPATINGYPVRYIDEYAFSGNTTLTTVTLPSTLQSIGKGAFKGCISLRKVDAGSRQYNLSIGESAFQECCYLSDFTVGESATVYYGENSFYQTDIVTAPRVRNLGENAFAECDNLQSVELLDTVTSIPYNAFYKCSQLRDITIPESVKYFGTQAFYGCSSLLELELPHDVESYGYYMLGGCSSLQRLIVNGGGKVTKFNIKVPEAVEYLEIGEGFTELDAGICYGVRTLKTVILPQSLKKIGNQAFYRTSVEEFDLPAGMESVGKDAFAENPLLSHIELDVETIGESVFKDCHGLTSATLSGMTTIPVSTFEGCVSLEEITIPAVTEIGRRAFYNCSFEEIDLKEGLTAIATEAFSANEGLKSITMPSTLRALAEKTFYECTGLESVSLNTGLETVGRNAFAYCSSLEELIIPDTVTSLGDYVAQECTALKKLYISGGVGRIYSYSIGTANSLEHLEYGEGITTIGGLMDSANYTALETIIFPSTLESISGSGAFKGCGVREVIIRGALKNVYGQAFMDCPNLETVIIEGDGATLGQKTFANTPALRTVYMSGVEKLEDSMFLSSGVESAVLTGGIKWIGSYAFDSCTQLESLTVDNTLEVAGSAMLFNCPSLKELRIGGKLSWMMFRDPGGREIVLPSLRVLEIGDGVTVIPEDTFADMVSELEVLTLPDGLVEIQRCAFRGLGENFKTLELPETLEIISFNAFEASHLETIEIPASVTEIRSRAFTDCKQLRSVTIHGENVTIGDEAFENCTALEEVLIRGSVKSIGYGSFRNTALKEFTIPAGIESIEEYAFADNPALRSFTLHGNADTTLGDCILRYSNNLEYLYIDGIETIGKRAFNLYNGLPGLRHLVIGEGVKTIGEEAFCAKNTTNGVLDYANLETLILPQSLETIGEFAFHKTGIRELKLTGGRLKSIGMSAFSQCKQLTSVTLDGEELAVDAQAFTDCEALQTVWLGSGVKSIGNYAFDDCDIRQLTLSEGLESLGRSAFNRNVNLKSVTLPDSITDYGDGINPFTDCTGLEYLYIGGGADMTLSSNTGILRLEDSVRHVEIAEGPTELKAAAFNRYMNYSRLETVVLPESMTVINEDNLSWFSGIKWVKVSSSMETIVNDNDYYYHDEYNNIDNTLTLITDTYNEVVAQYAADTGAYYIPLDGEIPEFEVKFFLSLDGVSGAEPVSTGAANLLGGLQLPQAPAQEGYRFTGWYYDAACTMPVPEGARIGEETTVYAGYVPNDVTLFALQLPPRVTVEGTEESTLVPEGYVLYARQEQTDGAATVLPAVPEAEGYVFTGWYRDSLRYMPFEAKAGQGHPTVLYGSFVQAGQGVLTESNATGVTITNYALTEIDSACVILPETIGGMKVTAIGPNAFKGLPVTELVIPAHVTDIDPQAFQGAAKLSRLRVDGRNEHFASVEGVLYNKDMTMLVCYPQGRQAASFTVPETVVVIADRAFEDCSYLRSITLKEGLETIGRYAFARTSLMEVALPDSVKNLGECAFANCRSLMEFTAYGLESIGSDALPGSPVLAVRGPVMQGALRQHVLGNNPVNLVYNIRYLSVMHGNSELSAFAVEVGMPLNSQSFGGMMDDGRVIRALYTDAALTQPADMASAMPDEDMTLYADVRPLYDYETITLESGETGLILTAYYGYGGEVILPREIDGQPVIALGEELMSTAQGEPTSVTIGFGVISIADTALCGPGGADYTGSVQAENSSPAALWAAQQGYPCEGVIYTLTFNTLGGAGIAAVQGISGMTVYLPEPVKSGAVFGGWYLDEGCTVPAQLDTLGMFVIPGEDVTLFAKWTEEGEKLPFTFQEGPDGVTITGYTGTDSQVVIPESINGLPVTAIADRAFLGRSGITSVTLPDTLISIGDNAFARMDALTSVVIPDSVESIGYAAFRGCGALESVHIGAGLETLGEQAFYGAASLKAFTAGEGGAFTVQSGVLYSGKTLVCAPAGMTGTLTIPENIETIAPYALAGSGLEAVVFPAALNYIGEGALYDCDSLKEITLGDSAMPTLSIPKLFAAGCDALTTVHLGSSVFAVGSSAFLNCPALVQAEIAPEVTRISDNAFAAAASGFTITGERGSAAQTYAAASGANFVAEDGEEIISLSLEAESIEMVLGQQKTLTVTAQPAMPEGETLRWASSDETIVTVTNGVIRCVGRGTATITVKAENGVSASMQVTVRGVPAETAALPAAELYVPLNGQATFTPIITPAWADNACQWRVADESIAAVDENGTVSGLTLGTTTLYMTTASGITASAVLHVYIATEGITLPEEESALTLNIIDSPQLQLHAAVLPENATFPTIAYASGNTNVVTVSESGLITVTGAGETVITLTNAHTTGDPAVVEIPVTVVPYDLSGEPAPEIPTKEYDGRSTPPNFDFTIGDRALRQSYDYSVTGDGSADLGTHTVTITGKGLFTGSITASFEIVEKQVTITYDGDTVFEEITWYDMANSFTSNVDRYSVKQAYAPADDPTNWSEDEPTEYGDYILKLYVEDSYGVKGCEVLVNIRLVRSLIKSLRFATDEIHVMEGQSFRVLLIVELEEGAQINFPSFNYAVEGDEGLISTYSTSFNNGHVYPIVNVFYGMEGTATLTASSSTYDVEPASLTVHVHTSAQKFALSGTEKVEEEAFYGTQANIITVGENSLKVGSRAFAQSNSLWQVVVPNYNVELSADMLEGSENAVVMFTYTFSDGVDQAIELGIPFAIEE